MSWEKIRRGFERLLEITTIVLMISLVVVVVVGVTFRKAGHSLSWYDEVAAILLAWLTYYGAALAAYRRAHIGVNDLVRATPLPWRLWIVAFAEACVITFFILLAWLGYVVLGALEGDTLVSLPEIEVKYTQSVIPIGAALFIIAQLLSLPEIWRQARTHEYKNEALVEP